MRRRPEPCTCTSSASSGSATYAISWPRTLARAAGTCRVARASTTVCAWRDRPAAAAAPPASAPRGCAAARRGRARSSRWPGPSRLAVERLDAIRLQRALQEVARLRVVGRLQCARQRAHAGPAVGRPRAAGEQRGPQLARAVVAPARQLAPRHRHPARARAHDRIVHGSGAASSRTAPARRRAGVAARRSRGWRVGGGAGSRSRGCLESRQPSRVIAVAIGCDHAADPARTLHVGRHSGDAGGAGAAAVHRVVDHVLRPPPRRAAARRRRPDRRDSGQCRAAGSASANSGISASNQCASCVMQK